MPIYDYYCEKCHLRFERYHSHMDQEPEPCPECGELSQRASHFRDQKLKRSEYVLPPRAKRHFGEERPRPPRRKRWI